ncbi:hypothetical protein GWK47_047414 [Chionoecetes opilio]|uniref:Uncharacterized protein n=1 Tax=Chionoecetes opilio TaxID=41210 RepID=A0A8J5CW12_CHIOP|nr:hypothetical protein GWK47_047414 [Chionoecetes opilio]
MLLKRDLQAIKREGELRYADPLVDALLEQDALSMGFNNSQSQDMVTESLRKPATTHLPSWRNPTVMEEDGSNIGELIKKEVDTWGRGKVARGEAWAIPQHGTGRSGSRCSSNTTRPCQLCCRGAHVQPLLVTSSGGPNVQA